MMENEISLNAAPHPQEEILVRRECLRCGTDMTMGRIFDTSYGGRLGKDGKPSSFRWMAENEKVSFFSNFGTGMRAFMCPSCGIVEMVGEDFIK
jgi:hypothetical protein